MGTQSQIANEPAVSLPMLDMSNPAHREAKAYSVDAAAVRFKISRPTLYRMIERGDVPAWRDERGHIKLLAEPTILALKNLRSR